ncbi:iron uptake porin [Kamptonema formosum]|uniref:iron uptake porin n=1 Tax=Kamptonema formosum TaxID=331992 RepID=UPI0004774EB6|nr:iron uptake porin [Oscillatoria sp. PCC 10802]
MSKILWNSLLVSPAVLGAALVVSASAMAAESGATPDVAKPETAAETKLSAPAASAVGDVAVAPVAVAEIAGTGSQEQSALSTEGLGAAAEVPVLTASGALEKPEAASGTPAAAEVPVLAAARALENPQAAAAETPAVAAEMPAAVTEVPVLAAAKALENSQVAPVKAEEQINLTPGDAPVAEKAQVPQQVAQMQPAQANPSAAEVLQQLNRYTNEGVASRNRAGQGMSVAQTPVTSVSQLSDVQPTDWAFQALQNLVERYGCIAGYPDGTYRGNRALTRYEFAAGLNACLERIVQLIQQPIDTSNFVTKADLATLNRLLEEFQAELATLRGRVDALEARTAELEANQFSTTTKLVGEAIFAGTDSIGETADVPAFQQRVRLNLNTSFTGRDLLITRLQVGNAIPLSVISESREGTQTFNVNGDTSNQFKLDTLEYFFPFGDRLDLVVAANAGVWEDFTPTLNPYMEDFDGGNGSISAFGQRNPIYRLGGGQGVGANIRFGGTNLFNVLKPSSLTLGYLASHGNNPSGGSAYNDGGFFRGDYSALAQLNFTLGGISMAATYVHSYFKTGNFGFDNGLANGIGSTSGFVGTNVANSLGGVADTNPIVANSYGLQGSLQLSPRFGISGWAGLTDFRLMSNGTGRRGEGEIWNYALTLAFPDLLKEGNLGGIVVGAQPYLGYLETTGPAPISYNNGRGNGAIPWHIEGFYKWQVTDNISLTPGVIWLLNPNQQNGDGGGTDDTVIGTLRGTFTF